MKESRRFWEQRKEESRKKKANPSILFVDAFQCLAAKVLNFPLYLPL